MAMNALLLQLVASRLGNGKSQLPADLLAGSAAGPANTDALLQKLAHDENPVVSAYARQLLDQREAAKSDPVLVSDVTTEVLKEATPEYGGQPREVMEDLTDQDLVTASDVEALNNELTELRNRLDDIAHALGACVVCWGNNPQCRQCRGRGRPGYSKPDMALFAKFVLPAVRSIRAYERVTRPNGLADSKSTPTNETHQKAPRAEKGEAP